jgi:type I restriction enzyme, S subunit
VAGAPEWTAPEDMTRERSEPLLPPAHRRFKAYPAYKDSGVEWLGEIPAHWEVTPLKHVANFINGFAFKPDEWGLEGTPIIRIENLNGGENFNCTTRTLPAKYCAATGELLFGWSGNRGTSFGPFLWSRDGTHYVNQHIFRVVDFAPDRTWMYWALRGVTFYVEKQAHGIIGMVHVTRGELGTIPIPVLPRQEQEQIAEFLDRETARIDGLVAKKERLIELLQEKRAALITQAVTKGLDPSVPMKDSGVEWLGQIPAHWEVKRIRHVVRRIEQGWSPDCENREANEDEWGVLKAGCVNRGQFVESEHKALPASLEPDPELEISPGDLLMSRASGSRELVGSVALVSRCRPRLLLCDKLFRLHVDAERGDRHFLAFTMNSRLARWQIEIVLSGGSGLANNIAQEVVKDLIVVLPPLDEQASIVVSLDRETARIDALMLKVREAIDRLKELRTALISAAVTGKIDVWAPEPPSARRVIMNIEHPPFDFHGTAPAVAREPRQAAGEGAEDLRS